MNAAVRRLVRPQLGWFAMPLGFAGLSTSWGVANAPGWSDVVSQVLALVALGLWAIWTTTYLAALFRRSVPGYAHAVQGPLLSFIPVVGLLLSLHYGALLPGATLWTVCLFVALLAVFDAVLIGHWVTGGPGAGAVHPGYFAPVVAGPFIATIALEVVGLQPAAWATFGVGIFFFVAIGGLVFERLMSAKVQDSSLPGTSILLAAPATADVAWLNAHANRPDLVAWALAGLVCLMVLVQASLLPRYFRVRFSMAMWTVSFPLASASNLAVRLIGPDPHAAWLRIGVLSLVTLTFAGLFVATTRRAIRLAIGSSQRATA